jgi:hypothetical protein
MFEILLLLVRWLKPAEERDYFILPDDVRTEGVCPHNPIAIHSHSYKESERPF